MSAPSLKQPVDTFGVRLLLVVVRYSDLSNQRQSADHQAVVTYACFGGGK